MIPVIRTATPADVPVVHTLIRELATYGKAPDEARATPAQLHDALFGDRPAIGFHEALGARPQDEWTVYRLTGGGTGGARRAGVTQT